LNFKGINCFIATLCKYGLVDVFPLWDKSQTWEAKMMQAGVVNAPIERSVASKQTPGVTPVHDLNVPYEGTEEYETPTADLLFPPVSFSCDFL
jgi:hypothetical protein